MPEEPANDRYGYGFYADEKSNRCNAPLPQQDWEAFSAIWTPFSANRKEILTTAGNREKYLYFVTVGVQRVYYFDDRNREAIALFQNLDAGRLTKPAANGGWSIAQCLDHLNGYGEYYLPCIDRGLTRYIPGNTGSTFQSSWIGRKFTKIMDPQTGSKKMKAFKKHIPSSDLDGHAVVATFIQQQETLISYLRRASVADLNKIRIPISIAKFIRLKLGDVFQFLIAHNERHLQQAKRNL